MLVRRWETRQKVGAGLVVGGREDWVLEQLSQACSEHDSQYGRGD